MAKHTFDRDTFLKLLEDRDTNKKLARKKQGTAARLWTQKSVGEGLLDSSGGDQPSRPIFVVCRVRPVLDEELSAGHVAAAIPRYGDAGAIDIHKLRQYIRRKPTLETTGYRLDQVYSQDDTNQAVYDGLVHPLVPWAWNGGVSTVFAYGQTGSGKTHTISGLERHVASSMFSPGLEGTRDVYVSIVELAGSSAFDLLGSRKPVSVLEDSFGTTRISGALEQHVTDAETLLKHIDVASSFRQTASTDKNDQSSRSHSICKIRIENPDLPEAEEGLMYLVDLAGFEAAHDRASHSSERMKETREINASLSVLKDCIRGIADLNVVGGEVKQASGKKPYIPFRQSRLTKLLKHVFDPDADRSCKTVLIACVNPCLADLEATKSTLRYATMLREVSPAAMAIKYDPQKLSNWSNQQFREWVGSNSGYPAINAEYLAPFETGKQILQLPAPEFVHRCLKTEGVSKEQALAFRTRLWSTHIDSQRPEQKARSEEVLKKAPPQYEESSREQRAEFRDLPFRDRLRPGMVVQERDLDDNGAKKAPIGGGTRSICMLLAPAADSEAYLVAAFVAASMPGAFELYPWVQREVDVKDMEAEVIMEYDSASKYYFESV